MKKDIRTLAALLIASATFVACSSDDNIANEIQQPANGKYTLTINASKSDDATTRALKIDDSGEKNVLNATWATTENVYVQKGSTWAEGSLQPQKAGTTTTLKGTLSGIDIVANDELTLQFPRSGARDYTGQVGTLADIAAKYDYATATVEVEGVSGTGNIIPKSETTAFASQQAIVKFTLIDKADGTTSLDATKLVVNDGATDYTITLGSAASEIYVAIPGFSDKTVTLTATVGSDTYTYERSDVTFTNGKYYEITVKMAPAPTTVTWNSTNVFNVNHEMEEVSKWSPSPRTYEYITISFTGTSGGSSFETYNLEGKATLFCAAGDSFTFTAPTGKKFTMIEIIDNFDTEFTAHGGWTRPEDTKIVWSGTAANTVTLGGSVYNTAAGDLNSIVFTLVDE